MAQLRLGDKAPDFSAADQDGNTVRLTDFKGRRLFVYFYPKANTAGCTAQAQAVRDALPELTQRGIAAVGVSPDPPTAQKKFAGKNFLGFSLLSDADHAIAEAYGVWGEKKMYGKSYKGIVRSAFLIDEKGCVAGAWYKISPGQTIPELFKAIG
jgi:peroxiredoxin Q/BCP